MGMFRKLLLAAVLLLQNQRTPVYGQTEPQTTIARSVAGVMVPSLAQSSATQTPINTNNASSATNRNQSPTTTAIDAQGMGTSGNATTGHSTPQDNSIITTASDARRSSPGTLIPPAAITTGDDATTQTLSTTAPPDLCDKVQVQHGAYTYSNNVASRSLSLIGPAGYFVNISIFCTPNCTVNGNNLSYTVGNLTQCELYNISVTGFQCMPPNYTRQYIWDVPPDRQRFNLSTVVHDTSVTFLWEFEDVESKPCAMIYEYRCAGGGNPITSPDNVETITNLEPNTNYSCSSTLTYSKKPIKNITMEILTDFGTPSRVENLDCLQSASNSTTIAFTWSSPTGSDPGIDGYLVNCNKGKEERVNSTRFSCSDFAPWSRQTVRVRAFKRLRNNMTHYTEGPEVSKECRTNSSEPGQVEKVQIYVESNTATITCKQPNHINGPQRKYILTFDDRNTTEEKCSFRLPDLSYLTTYKFKLRFSNGHFIGTSFEYTLTTKYNHRALIGFLVFLIIVTSIALIVVLFKIYKLQRASDRDACERVGLVVLEEENMLNVDPIPGDLLLETHRRKMADEGRLFLAEFQSIPRVFSKMSQKQAREPHNLAKNRYVDILPYDENRVALSMINGEPGSDYINASFINGFKEHRKYIAAQGPKEETTKDFWRMIWEQKSSIIVMVTRCEEGNRVKCAEYWPSMETGTLTFGDITVVIKDEKRCPDYVIRKLHVSNKREKSSEREVTHIQFISWPDHGVPDDPYLLLKLRRRVIAFSNFFSGPIIVHCSAGVGRTGTYISIDAMLEGLDSENRVDVYGYVVALRRQRCLMVQVEAQYILIHHALVEYFLFGETELSVPEIAMSLENLKKKDPPSDPSLLEAEFQRLPSYKNWRPQNVGNNAENRAKNRSSHVVPYEFNRVGIKQDEEQSTENAEDSDESSDDEQDYEQAMKYINASFINGYWAPKAMIAAQGPLQDTISDFWLMVFQRKVKVIVMLTPTPEINQESCAKYWGDQKQTYNDIQVEVKDVNTSQSCTVRLFEVRHAKRKETRKVYQYQYEHWSAKELPQHPSDLLTMVQKVKQKVLQNTTNEERRLGKASPVLIHCSDGAQQTGVVCALWNLLQCAEAEGAVDVFHTVKSLRKERPGFVATFEEYQFIYDILAMAYPAQNGQQQKSIRQEDEVQMVSETGKPAQKAPSLRQEANHPDPIKENTEVDKNMENSTNGPVAPAPTDIELKIE